MRGLSTRTPSTHPPFTEHSSPSDEHDLLYCIAYEISFCLHYQQRSCLVFSISLSHTHTHRDAGSRGGVTHSQDGDVLGPIQPPDRCPGLADPLHHGHIMLPVKNIIISGVISSSVLTVEDYYYAVEVEEMQIDFVFKAK